MRADREPDDVRLPWWGWAVLAWITLGLAGLVLAWLWWGA